MTKSTIFFASTFAIGLSAVAWIGLGFIGSSGLALAMTTVIAGVYLLGAFEIRQFRVATASLASVLGGISQPVAELGDWLKTLPPTLRNAVRLRIEGERVAMPGLKLTPYLVGLLVMLGMLGTFLGMVVTFKGTVFALEGSTDLQAIRVALAAPINGLRLSFGTSVAGVAASAMLGLMSAISRSERLDAAQLLDTRIATVFRPFSKAHQREEAFKALQIQAHALPNVVEKLQAMMDRMERRGQQLDAQLLGQQAQFHQEVGVAYTGLAAAVGTSLTNSLTASAKMAGESIKPVVEAAMTEISQESKRMHERLSNTAQRQVDNLSTQFSATATTVSETWTAALQHHARTSDDVVTGLNQALTSFTSTFETRSAALLASINQTASQSQADHALAEQQKLAAWTRWGQEHGERMDQFAQHWRKDLRALRDEETVRGQAAVERLGELQAALARHLATLGTALEAPLTRLLQTSSEVPQAAAEVITQLRQEMTRIAERDNLALKEHTGLIGNISTLVNTVNQASSEQRTAIESLVASAETLLNKASGYVAQTLDAHSDKAADVAAHVTSSAVELSSLGAAFGHSVQLFNAGNEKLVESLQRLEGSMNQSMVRSDEQLAYYVAQAREVVDLSISAQQGIMEDLRQLHGRQTALAEGAL